MGYGWITAWNGCGQLSYCHSGRGRERDYPEREAIERYEKLCGVVWRKVRMLQRATRLYFQHRTCTITYLAHTYVQRRYLNLKKWLIHDVYFHFWRAGPLMAEGFVIEVKNNKATAHWPDSPLHKDLDMNPMHYVWPLEQARIQESMWLLILLSFCCLSSDPSSKIVTRTQTLTNLPGQWCFSFSLAYFQKKTKIFRCKPAVP